MSLQKHGSAERILEEEQKGIDKTAKKQWSDDDRDELRRENEK